MTSRWISADWPAPPGIVAGTTLRGSDFELPAEPRFLNQVHGAAVAPWEGVNAGESPDADAIVNPNQPGCSFPSKSIAGVGVAFYLMLAVRACLREQGWFEQSGRNEPNMAAFLVSTGIATEQDLEALREAVDADVVSASELATEQPPPGPETVYDHVFSPTLDYTSRDIVLTSPRGWGSDIVPGGQLGYNNMPTITDELTAYSIHRA